MAETNEADSIIAAHDFEPDQDTFLAASVKDVLAFINTRLKNASGRELIGSTEVTDDWMDVHKMLSDALLPLALPPVEAAGQTTQAVPEAAPYLGGTALANIRKEA